MNERITVTIALLLVGGPRTVSHLGSAGGNLRPGITGGRFRWRHATGRHNPRTTDERAP